MELTKEGAQGLRMKMPKLYLKEATVIYGLNYLLTARLPELTWLSDVKIGKTRLLALVELREQEQAFN